MLVALEVGSDKFKKEYVIGSRELNLEKEFSQGKNLSEGPESLSDSTVETLLGGTPQPDKLSLDFKTI